MEEAIMMVEEEEEEKKKGGFWAGIGNKINESAASGVQCFGKNFFASSNSLVEKKWNETNSLIGKKWDQTNTTLSIGVGFIGVAVAFIGAAATTYVINQRKPRQ